MAQGSIYPTRIRACREGCGKPDSKTCPTKRVGHTGYGFIVNLEKLKNGKWSQVRRQRQEWTKADAERALRKELGDIDAGRVLPLASRQITVAEYAETWLADLAPELRPSSLYNYRHCLCSYITPRRALGSIRLVELNAAQVRRWRERVRTGELRTEFKQYRRPDGTLSPSTVNHIMSILRAMLAQAVDPDKLIPDNPAEGIKPVKTTGEEEFTSEVWSPQQADAFLAFVEGHQPAWQSIAYRLTLMLGLRRGELAALRWEDISDGRLTVRRNAVEIGASVVVGDPKSKAGRRVIPLALDPGMAAALRVVWKRQLAERLAAGPDWQDTGLIVADEHGAMLPPWRISEVFRRTVKASGLPQIRLHDCRHTAGTTFYEATHDLKQVASWLGHSSVAITEKLYVHNREAASDAAAARVALYRQQQSEAR
jgi:integrase